MEEKGEFFHTIDLNLIHLVDEIFFYYPENYGEFNNLLDFGFVNKFLHQDFQFLQPLLDLIYFV